LPSGDQTRTTLLFEPPVHRQPITHHIILVITMAGMDVVQDDPVQYIRRLTISNPSKRNALSNPLRTKLFAALEQADRDDNIRVIVIRGEGENFSSGYDLAPKPGEWEQQPFYTSGGLGQWPRHVTQGHFKMYDMAKPVIAQVAGYCLAGGSELATACDLVFCANDAKIGYPPVRQISPPDMQYHTWLLGFRKAMFYALTGDSMSGTEAAELGFANAAFPKEDLEKEVLNIAARVAQVPTDLQQINKRSIHRQMEVMGYRAAINAGTEMQALATATKTSRTWGKTSSQEGLRSALSKRDEAFGDYRVEEQKKAKL